MTARMVYEDFEVDFVFDFEVPALDREDIIEFASRFDPQRFHLDEGEAVKTHFGGLVASGFQTQLLCFQPFCREILANSHAVGAPGIDKLKWLRPWHPGEALGGRVKLMRKRPSSRRRDRGYLEFLLEADVDEAPLFSMLWTVIMLTREGAGSHPRTHGDPSN